MTTSSIEHGSHQVTQPPRSNLRTLRDDGRRLGGDQDSRSASSHDGELPGWERLRRRLPLSEGFDETSAYSAYSVNAVGRGRQTPTLQATWIDPDETPFVPVPRPGKVFSARLFSLVVMAAILGLLGWLIVPEVSFRLTNVDSVTVNEGVLTAQAVPLAPTGPAVVTHLYVDTTRDPDAVIEAGAPIAGLRFPGPEGTTLPSLLVAPFQARLVSVDSQPGSVTQPGTPVVTIYDPTKMYVIATVQPSTLDTLRQGMRAELRSPLISTPIGGTVISAVPLLGTDYEPSASQQVNVRIRPDEGKLVDLVPGIHFAAKIDLRSAPPGARPLVFTAGHQGSVTTEPGA